MRTSLIETAYIEDYLLQKLSAEEEVLFQAKMLLDKQLADNAHWQQETYQLIHTYGRRQLKQEILDIHKKLFEQPEHRGFRQSVLGLFGKR